MKTNILANNTNMKTYLKYFCAVLLVIGSCAHVWGQAPSLSITERVNIDASDFTGYYSPGANTASVGVVSVTTSSCYKNSCSGSPYIRLTSGSTMTVSALDGVITQVHFSPMTTAGCSGNGMDGKFSANSGSINQVTWTHATGVSSVIFTATSTADFRNFTVTIKHTSGTCPFTFPSSISMTVASGDVEEETVNITGTTGYSVQTAGLSTYDLGGGDDDSELSSYYSIPTTISVLGEVPGTYYGTFDVDYQRLTPYSYYSISIPITVTVTGCMDISGSTVTVNAVPTPTYNCSTDKWETTISWEEVTGASRYGLQLQSYSGGWSNVGAAVYVSAPTTSYTYTNLTGGTRYRVGIAAQNQSCVPNTATPAAASGEFTPTCPTITDLSASLTGVLSTSANMSWSATPGVCTTTYSVWVSPNSDYSSPVWTQTTSTNTSHSLTGLSSNTTYYVKITAFNECGNSQTRTGTFTTSKALEDYRYACIDIELVHTDAATDDTPIKITSAAGQSIKGIRTLTLTVDGGTVNAAKNVTLSGTDLLFYKTDGTQITGSVLQTDAYGDLAATTIVVAYAPSAYVSESFATPEIFVNCDGSTIGFSSLVTARCLPDSFVIASKIGNFWYALPANITSSSSNTSGIPIAVDNVADPSTATGPADLLDYGLRNVASGRYAANGSNLVFTERLSTATADNQKTLYNGSTTSIQVDAMYKGYHNTNPTKYEWISATSDLKDYTLTSASESRTISLNTKGVWGTLNSDKAYSGQVRLLPLTEITDMEVEVMEWGTSSMALRFAGDVPDAVDITLGANSWTNKALTNITSGGTSDLYSVSGLTLTGDNCTLMTIKDHDNPSVAALIHKPILVNGTDATSGGYKTALTDAVCEGCDVVILNGGKLTANQTKATHTSFANIYVYPGGKLVLDGYSLGVKQQVYVRGGYSWLNTSTYALPEVYLNGNINFNGSNNIIYDYYIHNYQYYQFCLPYTVPLANVTDEAGVDNFPVWVKHYNGALRAADASATSWDWYNGDNFNAGIGYIIAARPRQVGNIANRPLSIIRFPLGNTAFNGSGEEGSPSASRSVETTAHGIDEYAAGTVTANNVGWNLVGNPYMATWQAPAGGIGHRQLVKDPDEEHWNGSYKWVDAAAKYITIMSAESGSDYAQYTSANIELSPFFPFFYQETSAGGTGTLTFTVGSRQKKVPAYIRADNAPREAFVQIDIEGFGSTDQTGLYVSDKYSNDLDFDDMEKMFGSSTAKPKVWLMHESTRMAFEAVTEERAAGATPLGYRAPQEDTYMLAVNVESSQLEEVKAVLLTDNVEGVTDYDLLLSAYEFTSDPFTYNDTRFTIRIVLKDANQGSMTGLDDVDVNSEHPQKFLYRDKIYILRGGVIYDATGKQVQINK